MKYLFAPLLLLLVGCTSYEVPGRVLSREHSPARVDWVLRSHYVSKNTYRTSLDPIFIPERWGLLVSAPDTSYTTWYGKKYDTPVVYDHVQSITVNMQDWAGYPVGSYFPITRHK